MLLLYKVNFNLSEEKYKLVCEKIDNIPLTTIAEKENIESKFTKEKNGSFYYIVVNPILIKKSFYTYAYDSSFMFIPEFDRKNNSISLKTHLENHATFGGLVFTIVMLYFIIVDLMLFDLIGLSFSLLMIGFFTYTIRQTSKKLSIELITHLGLEG